MTLDPVDTTVVATLALDFGCRDGCRRSTVGHQKDLIGVVDFITNVF